MSQKKILIVDDNPEVRLSLHVRLKVNNYEVVFAEDGVAGIAEARKHMPDLILLDLGPTCRRWLQRSGEVESKCQSVYDPCDCCLREGTDSKQRLGAQSRCDRLSTKTRRQCTPSLNDSICTR